MFFQIIDKDQKSQARIGKLKTAHGEIETPLFMPIATYAAVKTLSSEEVAQIGYRLILSNTYHLYLRPGLEVIESSQGLHRWMNWDFSILTDSGGYQAFSLSRKSRLAKTIDEGVIFYSPWDGSRHFFTPEKVIDIQLSLGSDIVMVLDDCPPFPSTQERLTQAVERTRQWAVRSINYWQKFETRDKLLFGIIQGGCDIYKRQQSLKEIGALGFDGMAIGGVSVGEGKQLMYQGVDCLKDDLNQQQPRYLMGVGEPIDLINMIAKGIDMFDCVLPTRLARHGAFWVSQSYERLNIRSSSFAKDQRPLDELCRCPYCQKYSRSYLRAMFIIGEMLAYRALSYHNLYLIHNLLAEIKDAIRNKTFTARYKKELVNF